MGKKVGGGGLSLAEVNVSEAANCVVSPEMVASTITRTLLLTSATRSKINEAHCNCSRTAQNGCSLIACCHASEILRCVCVCVKGSGGGRRAVTQSH